MAMCLLDLLATVAKEEKIKLDEEEERKKRNQEQVRLLPKNGIQLEPLAKSKGKRSIRRELTTSMMHLDDHQEVLDNLHHKPESDPAVEETSDHQEKKVEKEFKKVTSQKEKRKVNKVVSDNDNNDDDYGLKQKKDRKRKVTIVGFDSPPLPKQFKERIKAKAKAKGGVVGKEIKVIEKSLTRTDTQFAQNRFSIPVNQMKEEFLLPEELEFLKNRTPDGAHWNTMEVKIIEPSGKVEKVGLSRLEMRKEFGKISVSYVLKGDWKKVLTENRLQEGQMVQLWAIRIGVNEELCFAFVVLRLREQEEEGSTCKTSNVDNGTNNSTPVSCVGGEAEEAKASSPGEKDGEVEEVKADHPDNGQAEVLKPSPSSGVVNKQSEPEYNE